MNTGDRDTAPPPLPGRRVTRQRAAVVELLAEKDDFRSAQDLHDELRGRGEEVGLTTVYRTLQSLSESGEIDMLRTDSGEALYRRCSPHHHHHLLCRDCGYTVEIESTGGTVGTNHGGTSRVHRRRSHGGDHRDVRVLHHGTRTRGLGTTRPVSSRCPSRPADAPDHGSPRSSVRTWDAVDTTSINNVPNASGWSPCAGKA